MNKRSRLDLNPVSYFVQILYKECKTHKLTPALVVKWIIDMLDFSSVATSTLYSTSNEQPLVGISEYVNDNEGKGDKDVENSYVKSITPYTEHTSFPNALTEPRANVIDLPLVSKVSFFIDQKKDEISRLQRIEKEIKNRIQKVNEQKIKTESEVDALIKEHTEIFRYFSWYKNINKELSAKFNLKLENEIGAFCKAVNDFKRYDYDPCQIISVYKDIESLNQVRESIRAEINQETTTRNLLSRQVSDLQNQLSFCSQTISVYNDIHTNGFGLKELKILQYTLAQIAIANNLRLDEIGKKFLNDVEDHYDDKVGFENNIAELKREKTRLQEDISFCKSMQTMQTTTSDALLRLHENGVTDQNIIFLSQLLSNNMNDNSLFNYFNNQNNSNPNHNPINSSNNDDYNSLPPIFRKDVERLKERERLRKS